MNSRRPLGTSPPSKAMCSSSVPAMSSEASRDQPSTGLNATILSGRSYWSVRRSSMSGCR